MTPLAQTFRANAVLLFRHFHLENMADFENTMWFAITVGSLEPREAFEWVNTLIEDMRFMNRASADLGFVTLKVTPSEFASLSALAVVQVSDPSFEVVFGERVFVAETFFEILQRCFPGPFAAVSNVAKQPRKGARVVYVDHPGTPRINMREDELHLIFLVDEPPMGRSML